jgi:hypothetical protein
MQLDKLSNIFNKPTYLKNKIVPSNIFMVLLQTGN